jgi:hypothetical protein
MTPHFIEKGKLMSVLKVSHKDLNASASAFNELHSLLCVSVGSENVGYIQIELGTELKKGGK